MKSGEERVVPPIKPAAVQKTDLSNLSKQKLPLPRRQRLVVCCFAYFLALHAAVLCLTCLTRLRDASQHNCQHAYHTPIPPCGTPWYLDREGKGRHCTSKRLYKGGFCHAVGSGRQPFSKSSKTDEYPFTCPAPSSGNASFASSAFGSPKTRIFTVFLRDDKQRVANGTVPFACDIA